MEDGQPSYSGVEDGQPSHSGVEDGQHSGGGVEDGQHSHSGVEDGQNSGGGVEDDSTVVAVWKMGRTVVAVWKMGRTVVAVWKMTAQWWRCGKWAEQWWRPWPLFNAADCRMSADICHSSKSLQRSLPSSVVPLRTVDREETRLAPHNGLYSQLLLRHGNNRVLFHEAVAFGCGLIPPCLLALTCVFCRIYSDITGFCPVEILIQPIGFLELSVNLHWQCLEE